MLLHSCENTAPLWQNFHLNQKKRKRYSDMLCSLLKTDCNEPIYCFNSYSNYSKHPRCSLTLNEKTFSFIRFINILQATEHNKGKIK